MIRKYMNVNDNILLKSTKNKLMNAILIIS